MITKQRGLGFFGTLFLGLNILVCASMLLSYLAPVINPANHWSFAFFGLAYPILLVINLVFAFIWILNKSLWFLLPISVILIGWGMLNKNIGLRRANKPGVIKSPNAIRIMTYNVHSFKLYGSANDTDTRNSMLDIVKQQNPDVVGFQEFYSSRRYSYRMVSAIRKVLKTENYYFIGFQNNTIDSIGIAIFSKYPIIGRGLIMLSDDYTSENQCLYIDVKKDDRVFRMYSVHLESTHFESEDYTYLKGISRGKTDMHGTKRLAAKLKIAFVKRAAQVLKVKQSADACPYPYIISGDFNDTPSSFAVNEMSKGLKNAFCEKGSGFGRTYNGDFPNFQIDYILASPGLDVLTYDIIEKRLSDHYPVVSDVVLK
ncbi:endonuclease/exonuclease/phosphatase family protein [Mucilaginibacter sp.]